MSQSLLPHKVVWIPQNMEDNYIYLVLKRIFFIFSSFSIRLYRKRRHAIFKKKRFTFMSCLGFISSIMVKTHFLLKSRKNSSLFLVSKKSFNRFSSIRKRLKKLRFVRTRRVSKKLIAVSRLFLALGIFILFKSRLRFYKDNCLLNSPIDTVVSLSSILKSTLLNSF